MKKDERLQKLAISTKQALQVLSRLVEEKDKKLLQMSNTEWGDVQGQRLQAQADALEAARLNLLITVEHLKKAETFDV